MFRFALVLIMSLAVSSHAVAAGAPFKKATIAYEKGDYSAAFRIFTSLAEKGDMVAQFNLAKMYREGKGVSKNHKTAVNWFGLSAEQGNTFAQHHLSLLYYFGNGVPQNSAYAYMWANQASANGFEMAEQLHQVLAEQMTPSQIDEAISLAKSMQR